MPLGRPRFESSPGHFSILVPSVSCWFPVSSTVSINKIDHQFSEHHKLNLCMKCLPRCDSLDSEHQNLSWPLWWEDGKSYWCWMCLRWLASSLFGASAIYAQPKLLVNRRLLMREDRHIWTDLLRRQASLMMCSWKDWDHWKMWCTDNWMVSPLLSLTTPQSSCTVIICKVWP